MNTRLIAPKGSVTVTVSDGNFKQDDFTTHTIDNPTIGVKTHCPLPHSEVPLLLPIGKGQPTNTKWVGVYSLSNILSQKLAIDAPITLTIDFENGELRSDAPLTLYPDKKFMIDGTFNKDGWVTGKFYVNTDDSISGNIFPGRVVKDCIHLEFDGIDYNSNRCSGGLLAFPQ